MFYAQVCYVVLLGASPSLGAFVKTPSVPDSPLGGFLAQSESMMNRCPE